MIKFELDVRANPLRTAPRFKIGAALKKTDALPRVVPGAGNADRAQGLIANGLINARQINVTAEQNPQRRVVQQRTWCAVNNPAEHQGAKPVCGGFGDAERVGSVNLVRMKMLPDIEQALNALGEIVRVRGQNSRIDRTCRRAAHDREGVFIRLNEQLTNRLEHTDLISGARTTASQNEGRVCIGRRHGFVQIFLLASTDNSAARLTMRRTVAVGVNICTGRAEPSSNGPTVSPSPATVLSRL